MPKMFLGLVAITAILFTACTNCSVCTQPEGSDVKVCEKDYNSPDAYTGTINAYEMAGYSCYKSFN